MRFLCRSPAIWKKLQPLDRIALLFILGLALLIGLMLGSGDRTYPKIRDFSWQNQTVGVNDVAFVLTFNRAMNWDSVTQNLIITPPLPGKMSWSGRRLAYTLTQPIPYGQQFELKLEQATGARGTTMQPFRREFRSRDTAFVYLGISGEENGRLMLQNLTQKMQAILTPSNLTVLDFKVDPGRDRILFRALERTKPEQTIFEAKLYTVPIASPNKIELLLDNPQYQILKFDVTSDGQTTIVQRFDRGQGGTVSLWKLDAGGTPQLVTAENVDSDVLITADGKAVAVSQNQGLAILSLDPDAPQQPIRFLPKYHHAINFTRDGSAALMVKYNSDSTRSLFFVPNNGVEQELLTTTGYFFDARFDPQAQIVYCLYSRFNPDAGFRSDLQLSTINIKGGEQQLLKTFPGQATGHISLAPDLSGLLYEELTVTDQPHPSVVRNIVGQTITDSKLWLLPLPTKTESPQRLAAGLQPQWVP